jgi:hypothetical protein
MGGCRAGLAALALTAVLASCGGTAAKPLTGAHDREWAANLEGVIDQFQRDLELAAGGGATVAAARRALRDESHLYTILVAYTDFGGCAHMVAAAGDAPPRFAGLRRTLGSACALLQQAAALFTRATTANDPGALVDAGRRTLRALPLLLRVKEELVAAMPQG